MRQLISPARVTAWAKNGEEYVIGQRFGETPSSAEFFPDTGNLYIKGADGVLLAFIGGIESVVVSDGMILEVE